MIPSPRLVIGRLPSRRVIALGDALSKKKTPFLSGLLSAVPLRSEHPPKTSTTDGTIKSAADTGRREMVGQETPGRNYS